MTRFLCAAVLGALVGEGCTSRELPPPPENAPPPPVAPACKIFHDAKYKTRAACCVQPAATVLKAADIASACGATAAAFVGETRDGTACRYHFKVGQGDPNQSYVMISRPLLPPGTPAPMGPDPLLPWNWKKVPLDNALGSQAVKAPDGPAPPEGQTILWAGRGRRILGLHVSKQVCSEAQAHTLLQKAIDAIP